MDRDRYFKNRESRTKKPKLTLSRQKQSVKFKKNQFDYGRIVISSLGNSALQKLGDGSFFQAKFNVSQPGDFYEQQADTVAEQILSRNIINIMQLKSDTLQTKGGKGDHISGETEAGINHLKGRGNPISHPLRQFFEPRLGVDLRNVRIHTGNTANKLTQTLNARAFTYGNNIVFKNGEYQPGSMAGKKLLAHELVHTIQQGAVGKTNQKAAFLPTIQRKSTEPDLYEQARKEKEAGDPILSNALNNAFMKPLAFEFEHELKGNTVFTLRAGEKLKIQIRSKNADGSSGGAFRLSLNGRSGLVFIVPVPSLCEFTWNIPHTGEYTLQFASPDNPKTIKGIIIPEIITGPGETGDLSDPNDKWELENGIKTGGAKSDVIARIDRVNYVLRSEPTKYSYIFGTLPGTPLMVKVLDKKSFSKDGSDTWYKIQFLNNQIFEKYAINKPDPDSGFTNAIKAYNEKYAWVTRKALKVFLSFETFLTFIKNFETDPGIKGLTLKDRITKLRQIYSESFLESDDMIGTPAGKKTVEDRPSLSGLYTVLKLEETGIALENGELIDAGHIILTLDAYNHPEKDVWKYGLYAGKSHALASWSGDLGGAIGNYMSAHIEKGKTSLDTTLLDLHFAKSAPDNDLLGNIDGLGVHLLSKTKSYKSIEELLRDYYQGSSNYTTDNYRAYALKYLLESLNYSLGPSKLYNAMHKEGYYFGWIWFLRNSGVGGVIGSTLTFKHKKHHTLLKNTCTAMTNRLVKKIFDFAKKYNLSQEKYNDPEFKLK